MGFTMRKWFVISTLLLFVCLIGAGIAQEKSAPAQVAGEWSIPITFSRITANHKAIIVQKADTLSGTYKGELTEGLLRGIAKGDTVEFRGQLNYMSHSALFDYTATIDGDTMKGTVNWEIAPGGYDRILKPKDYEPELAENWTATFTAKRKK